LEWHNDQPPYVLHQQAMLVYVTIIEKVRHGQQPSNGQAMADALTALASLPSLSITHPIAWERDIRQDRALPDRDVRC